MAAFDAILASDVKMLRPRPQSSGSYRAFRYNDEAVPHGDDDSDEDDDDETNTSDIIVQVNSTEDSKRPEVIWIVGKIKNLENNLINYIALNEKKL